MLVSKFGTQTPPTHTILQWNLDVIYFKIAIKLEFPIITIIISVAKFTYFINCHILKLIFTTNNSLRKLRKSRIIDTAIMNQRKNYDGVSIPFFLGGEICQLRSLHRLRSAAKITIFHQLFTDLRANCFTCTQIIINYHG